MNYIRQQLGLLTFGNSTIDGYTSFYVDDIHLIRDHRAARNITKSYKNILIIGMFPVALSLMFDSNITILDDSYILEYYKPRLEELYKFNIVLKSSLFDDIQEYIDQNDLIIYHDSEFGIPVEYMKYKHKDRDVFVMNTYENQYKHCINYAYSKEDLLHIFPMKEVYSTGKVPFITRHSYLENAYLTDVDTLWAYGKIDD